MIENSRASFFPPLLTISFAGLKTAGYIDWSWWWIISPTLIAVAWSFWGLMQARWADDGPHHNSQVVARPKGKKRREVDEITLGLDRVVRALECIADRMPPK